MGNDLLAAIGSDRHLCEAELGAVARDPRTPEAWDVYQRHFAAFSGARADAQFARLEHPATAIATPVVGAGTTVVIAGTGPSLATSVPAIRAHRARWSVWTSPRGAEVLMAFGLAPDLVLVQHRTELDAYLSARHLGDRDGRNVLAEAPVVLAEPRTPAVLTAGLDLDRLGTFDPAIGWGLWPASLASLAVGSGAGAVALAGLDLGTVDAPDPAFDGLRALLALIARTARVPTVDLGGGSPKPGWVIRDARELPDAGSAAVTLARVPWATRDERRHALWLAVTDCLEALGDARVFHDLATRARLAGGTSSRALDEAWHRLLAWRQRPRLRVALQEELGLRLLPALWRQADDRLLGPAWRPILLATDELLRQAQAAYRLLDAGPVVRVA